MYKERFLNREYSTSGWSTDRDFFQSRGCMMGSWTERPEEGGVILYGKEDQVAVDGGDECRHVLLVGATGTGKTRLVILPSLLYSLEAKKQRSFVIFDVKGELQAATQETARARGYAIKQINFRNPSLGDSWNPFYRANALHAAGGAQNKEKAWKLLENVIASIFQDVDNGRMDAFWRNSSSNLFRGTSDVLWTVGKDISFQAIIKLTDSIPSDKDDDDECLLFKMADRMPAAKRMLAGVRSASNQTRGNIISSYRSYLSGVLARDDVLKMVSGSKSVDFKELGEKPTVLYISLPDDSLALGALQGILLTQMMQELNECAMQHGGRLPVRTEFYLDEFSNIRPAIPAMETALTIARSRGMRYVLAVQSYAQLEGVYGTAAETIAANASTWISLGVAKDEAFRTKLSKLCGANDLGEALITPSQLARLRYGQAVVIREGCAPYFTVLEDFNKAQEYRKKRSE